jgi:phospholipid/cholesterol/gamma-HCH transport system permease protein
VLAIQGAGQFAKLGATDLVANLVAFSILREIGPLITAVIVIGRSGSAITAELGTMKVAEEIEALNVMGIDPVKFLVVPRLLAMIIMMPVLTILGEGVGLFAGWLISVTSLHLDPIFYVTNSIARLSRRIFFPVCSRR